MLLFLHSISFSVSWVLQVKIINNTGIQKCSFLKPSSVYTFTMCFASHWICHKKIWRGANIYTRFYVGSIYSLRLDCVCGNYTHKNKTGLVCTRWTNKIVKSRSFGYAMVRCSMERHISSVFSCLTSEQETSTNIEMSHVRFFRRKYFMFSM